MIEMIWGAAKGFALMSIGFVLGMLFMRENYLGIIQQMIRERHESAGGSYEKGSGSGSI